MLNKPIEEIVMENGKVVGVKSEGEVSSQLSISVFTHSDFSLNTVGQRNGMKVFMLYENVNLS